MQFPSLRATAGSPVLYIAFYCSATLMLLFFNKWLFTENREFGYVLTITWLQQLGVVALLLTFRRVLAPIMGDITFSKIVFRRVAPVGILASVDYTFSNLALKIIPMTIYEIVKSCAPAVVLMLSILLGLMQPSLKLTMVVILIVSGAIIAVYRPQHVAEGAPGAPRPPPIAVSVEGLVLIITGAIGSAMKSVAAQMSLHGNKKLLKRSLRKSGALSMNASTKGRVALKESGKLSNSYRGRDAAAAAEEGGANKSLTDSLMKLDREAYEEMGPVNPITVAFYCGVVISVALIPLVYIREGDGLRLWWATVPAATKAKNLGFVWLSSVMSIFVSISSFLVMRETSALTFAVVALGERILIVIVAIITLGESLPLLNASGFAVTLIGIAWYNQMKSRSHGAAPAAAAAVEGDTKGATEDSKLVKVGSLRVMDPMAASGHPSPVSPFGLVRFDSKSKFALTSTPGATLFVPAASDFDTSEDEEQTMGDADHSTREGYGGTATVDEGMQAGTPEAVPIRKSEVESVSPSESGNTRHTKKK